MESGEVTDLFTTNKDLRLANGWQCGDYYLEHLCGRPMQLQFDADGLRLIALDAYKGLLSIDLEGEKFEYLARDYERTNFKFLHSMAISEATGKIYFTESSNRYWYREYFSEILEARGRGRLLCYDPREMSLTVLADKLRFPSGLLVESKGKEDVAVIFSETSRARVRRCTLADNGLGETTCKTVKTFSEKGLPCLPGDLMWDHLSAKKDSMWVGCAAPRSALVEAVSGSTSLRQILASIRSDLVDMLFGLFGTEALARVNSKGKVIDIITDAENNAGLYHMQAFSGSFTPQGAPKENNAVLLSSPHRSHDGPWIATLE
jgi:hypothetical protein